jgi:hypothetical protein
MCVFGTVSVSLTFTHNGCHGMLPKYSAAVLISASVIAFANSTIRAALRLRASLLFRFPFL